MKFINICFFCIVGYWAQSQYIVPIKKLNGLNYIDCVVDGEPIEFIFDTGAGSTCLSEDAFNKLKNHSGEYIRIREETFQVADGSYVDASIYSADSLCIGKLCFNNVEFCVMPSLDAPCLLGQNIFKNLYSYEIQSNQIILTPRSYLGEDYYQKYSKETLIDLSLQTFETYFDVLLQGKSEFEFKISNTEHIVDKYDSTLIFCFDTFSDKTYNDTYSRVKYFDLCEKYTKGLIGTILFDLISDAELKIILKEEIVNLKIEEFQFNIFLNFSDKEYCFKRIVYTNQFLEESTFNSLKDIQIY
jgi:hypothetical protein